MKNFYSQFCWSLQRDEHSLKEIRKVFKQSGTLELIWNGDVPSISIRVKRPFRNIEFLYENVHQDTAIDLEDLIQSIPMSEDKQLETFHVFPNMYLWAQITGNTIYAYDVQVPHYHQGNWRPALFASDQCFFPVKRELFLLYNGVVHEDSTFKTLVD